MTRGGGGSGNGVDGGAGEPRPVVLDRRPGLTGELVLRRRGAIYELLIDGTFCMSDHLDGASERRQVALTLDAAREPRRLLLGGLGLGLAAERAVEAQQLTHIVVAEVEPTIVAWHRTLLRPTRGSALDDPRVEVRIADVADVLSAADRPFDAIALDVDNGPDWLIRPANARLYEPAFLDVICDRLAPAGAFSIWSERRVATLATALQQRFAQVEEHQVPVPRGEPDWLCVAARPRAG